MAFPKETKRSSIFPLGTMRADTTKQRINSPIATSKDMERRFATKPLSVWFRAFMAKHYPIIFLERILRSSRMLRLSWDLIIATAFSLRRIFKRPMRIIWRQGQPSVRDSLRANTSEIGVLRQASPLLSWAWKANWVEKPKGR